jgi:hypothetical protein
MKASTFTALLLATATCTAGFVALPKTPPAAPSSTAICLAAQGGCYFPPSIHRLLP